MDVHIAVDIAAPPEVAPGMRVFGHHSVDPVPGGSRATLRLYYQGARAPCSRG
jgi:hypothetical protein